jgi:cobalt-zinc-cadmium efflux system protein
MREMSDRHAHDHPHDHPHAGADDGTHDRRRERMRSGRDHAHDHGPAPTTPSARQALVWALALTFVFALVEAAGGWWSGSLALLSDAGHMLTDAAALGLALFANRIAARPPTRRASYGYARAEVIAAFVNALLLLALVVFIVVEAVRRLLVPEPVAGGVVLVIALFGLVVNLVTAWILSRATRTMNTHGALLHVLSDLLGSAAAIVAGAVIVGTGWTPIDPILSIAVSLLILRSTWRLMAQSIGVLMERVPAHLDYDEIGGNLSRIPGITGVHDLHVWHVGADRVALSAHIALADGGEWPVVLARAQRLLRERYDIEHATLQPSWPPPVRYGDRRVIPIAGRPEG